MSFKTWAIVTGSMLIAYLVMVLIMYGCVYVHHEVTVLANDNNVTVEAQIDNERLENLDGVGDNRR